MNDAPLIKTRYRIIGQDGATSEHVCELPAEPTYEQLRRYVGPALGGAWMERVRVFADYDGGTQLGYTDMFVDESFATRDDYTRNVIATALYRANVLVHEEGISDPESLPEIRGPAVLFDRPVWF